MDSPFSVLAQLAKIFEEQEISYVLVGSLASSMHGMYRSTADIDILADVKPKHIRPLLDALADAFYIDATTSHCFELLRQSSIQVRSGDHTGRNACPTK